MSKVLQFPKKKEQNVGGHAYVNIDLIKSFLTHKGQSAEVRIKNALKFIDIVKGTI